jgi:hypothetical protein
VTTPNIAALVDRADGHRPSALAAGRQVRIVLRLPKLLLARVDALGQRLLPWHPYARAAVLRAFAELGCTLAEEQHPVAPSPAPET